MTKPDWSSLPQDLLARIAKHLHTRVDLLRFRAVCNSFRASLPPPPISSSPFANFDCYYDKGNPPNSLIHLVLVEYTVYAIEPLSETSHNTTIKTWFAKVEESNCGKIHFRFPFSRLSPLDYKNMSQMLPKSLNLLDYRVKEIAKEYTFKFADDQPRTFIMVDKVDVSTDEFVIMALINRQLVVWKSGNKNGFKLDIGDVDDVIYHNNKFYVLIRSRGFVTVDPVSLMVTEAATPNSVSLEYMSMVKSTNDLFLTHRYGKNVNSRYCLVYDIFKLDERRHEWIKVKDGLKDRAFFLSGKCSFTVSAKDLLGCKWNCVYLTFGRRVEIFNLQHDSSASLPEYSKIFWPPPTWIFPEGDQLTA